MPITEINKPQIRIHQLDKTTYDAIPGSELENDSLYAVDLELGKNGAKLLQSNTSGDIEETSKTITDVENKLEGVQVNGSDLTIDVNKKVNIPLADNNTFGVMKPTPAYGLSALGNNVVGVSDAKAGGDALITAKANAYRPLTPRCIDLAVKTGITTNTLTLSDTEQRNAQSWLGTTDMEIEFSDGSESTLSLVGKM